MNPSRMSLMVYVFTIATLLLPAWAFAETDEELAKKLQNPVADMISIPVQVNYDHNIGVSDDGEQWVTKVEPVIPIHLNKNWNVISRSILLFTHQNAIYPGSGSQTGFGDITQSFFLSPVKTQGGWIWGAGPVFLLPTGTDRLLTSDKWGAGPTGVALRQDGPWTYGGLFNHIWSFAGDDDRSDVNATYLQPFVSYTTHGAWTFALNTESTYDWTEEEWSVPINLTVSKLTKIMGQSVSVGVGVRQWVQAPDSGAEGLGFRLTVTFLLPE